LATVHSAICEHAPEVRGSIMALNQNDPSPRAPRRDLQIAVIGAGMSGILAGIRLLDSGLYRFVMSDTFYPAIQNPKARLVTAAIGRIEAGGVRTKEDVLYELDVPVLATGFDGHRFMRPMQITGAGGATLDEFWADGVAAHCCLTLPGFPNFFVLIGPNSPIGNFSLILIAELH
jgi:cation diffusion facilitator CzcD-associated flavoprotein CzcO